MTCHAHFELFGDIARWTPRCRHLPSYRHATARGRCFASNEVCDCYTSYSAIFDALREDEANCPDCIAERQANEDRLQANNTIDPRYRYGAHIDLTCRLHPHLTWNTKNIDYIGARTIFFRGWDKGLTECQCSLRHLIPVANLDLAEAF